MEFFCSKRVQESLILLDPVKLSLEMELQVQRLVFDSAEGVQSSLEERGADFSKVSAEERKLFLSLLVLEWRSCGTEQRAGGEAVCNRRCRLHQGVS